MREHLRLVLPLFGFIGVVWALRFVLSAAGAPEWLARGTSVTTAMSVSIAIAAFLIHRRNFGSYPSVVVAAFLIVLWSEFLIILAVVFSVVTRTVNIYTFPEYSMPGEDPYHLRHIWGHLTFGVGLGTLEGAAVGCLLLWLLRVLVPSRAPQKSGA
jgi:hypothetical protein